jgi:hypothetical protein
MNKVERISDFPKEANIAQFFGKDYAEAVAEANKTKNVKLLAYYEQLHVGKSMSILVAYENEEK